MQNEQFMHTSLFFQRVNVFDGHDVIPECDVMVEQGHISAVGHNLIVPAYVQIIDGAGKTLLPGLIDAHTHVFGEALREALIFGVTTELDMFMDPRLMADVKRREAAGENGDAADLRSAGMLATAPGGHGTEYGIPVETLTSPEQAQAFVDARIAEGSDYIKIIYDTFRGHTPGISKEIMAALVIAAHRRGKLAVVHISTLADAHDAIEVGADGLAHIFADAEPDAAFGRFVVEHRAFVVPTLTVVESLCGIASGASLVTDKYITPYLNVGQRSSLQGKFSLPTQYQYANAEAAVRQLKAAGVPLLAGTDAPNPGTAHGVSLHRELELLVRAGLTPREALTAATATPATIFGLSDRGRIAVGLRADLLLVGGDPTQNILATRAIIGIWKQGLPVSREQYRQQLEQARLATEQTTLPKGAEAGLISDFADGTARTAFGAGWMVSTDSVRGGKSTAHYEVVSEGVHDGKGSLRVTGEIATNSMPWLAWAGVMFSPGEQPFTPVNLSAKKGLSFWAKGDGKTYRVQIISGSFTALPQSVNFTADAEWRYYQFAWGDFGRIESHALLAILFVAGLAIGPFTFQIADIRLV